MIVTIVTKMTLTQGYYLNALTNVASMYKQSNRRISVQGRKMCYSFTMGTPWPG